MAWADLRIATYNTELSRDGPGLLLRDIKRGEDQVVAVAQGIADVSPDILVLQSFDYDHDNLALRSFAALIAEMGPVFPHLFALRPNSGRATGLDLNGDGRFGTPRDAQGYGRFDGHGGMAVLSRFPIATTEVKDLSQLLWRDASASPLADLMSTEVAEVQRLSSVAHWIVPIDTPLGRVSLLTFHATPPVFDGPEDRNGRRNTDEIALWVHVLDGEYGPVPENPIVIGDANNDPNLGEGLKPALRALMAHWRLQDPEPIGALGRATVDWPRVGQLRVDYVLLAQTLNVTNAGVHWPRSQDEIAQASRHGVVWVDLTFPTGPD